MIKAFLIAAVFTVQAQTPPERCITRQQVSDMVVVMAPYLIEGLRGKCGSHLEATSFLLGTGATELASRMRTAGETRWDSAIDAFMLFAPAGDTPPRNVSRAMILAGMSEGLADEILGPMNRSACRDANAIVEAMSTMSPDQVGRLVGGIMGLSTREQARPDDPRICPE